MVNDTKDIRVAISDVLARLWVQIEMLEESIITAKYSVPESHLDRIEAYEGIVQKQKELMTQVESSLESNDFETLAQQLKVVNSLSYFIKDDAATLLEGSPKAELDD